jgi:hypothetical protein
MIAAAAVSAASNASRKAAGMRCVMRGHGVFPARPTVAFKTAVVIKPTVIIAMPVVVIARVSAHVNVRPIIAVIVWVRVSVVVVRIRLPHVTRAHSSGTTR